MPRIPVWALLVALLIFGAFYIGLSTDFLAFARGAQQLLYALTGRNEQGNFVNYPGGAPSSYVDPYRR